MAIVLPTIGRTRRFSVAGSGELLERLIPDEKFREMDEVCVC